MEGVPGKARAPAVCFGDGPSELRFPSGVRRTCLLCDAFCVSFPDSAVRPIQPALARAHFFQCELCAPAENWCVQC